jgi:16S rRNA (cytosine967-C5)-methyltransferase
VTATPERLAAARVLVRQERSPGRADRLLREALTSLSPSLRPRAHALVYAVLRHRQRLVGAIAELLPRPFDEQEPELRAVLLQGAAELRVLSGSKPHAAVSQAVDLIGALGRERLSGLTNAVLRTLASTVEPPPPSRQEDPIGWAEAACSHPRWLLIRMARDVGPDEAALWAEANQQEPRTALAFRSTEDRERGAAELPGEFDASGVFVLEPGSRPDSLPGWTAGAFWVQDGGAQAAMRLLDLQVGERVWDLCAAPGGKALAAAAAVGPTGHVRATDADPRRLPLLTEHLRRTGLPIDASVRDLLASPPHGADGLWDAVVVDAPCSALGVIRRHPEVRALRREADLPAYATRQRALLLSAAKAVRPGGRLLYAVCTFTAEETDDVIASVLSAREDLRLAAALRTYPHRDGTDAFYAAVLTRTVEDRA